jgi:GT2 family glycosyltransferase
MLQARLKDAMRNRAGGTGIPGRGHRAAAVGSAMLRAVYMHDVSVVVCTHNSEAIVGDTLRAIAGQTIGRPECIVVDGRSSDGTVALLRSNFPWVQVLVKDIDSGPAASRNIGMRASTARFVALVDSDVRLHPDWLERQLELLAAHPEFLVAGGLLVEHDDPSLVNIGYGALNRFGIAWDEQKGIRAAEAGPLRRCMWVATAAVLVRRQEALTLGGFDEQMFAFHEDVDFGWRANLFGHQVAFNPNAVAVHRAHATLNRSKMGGMQTYLLWRNRLRSSLINYEAHNVLRYVGAYLMMSLLVLLLRPERREKVAALLWNIRSLPDTWRRRRFVQNGRRVSDGALRSLQDARCRGPGQ